MIQGNSHITALRRIFCDLKHHRELSEEVKVLIAEGDFALKCLEKGETNDSDITICTHAQSVDITFAEKRFHLTKEWGG